MPEVKEKPKQKFGVFQKEVGSYVLGDHRFPAGSVTTCPAETAALADPDESPVKFFDAIDDANAELGKLKKVFASRPKQ